MTAPAITVAIPVLQGENELEELLPAIRSQIVDQSVEIVVADSESTDGSAEIARKYGANVIPVRRAEFSHGGTRNILMERSHGALVAFLTQDALPKGDRWLAEMADVFSISSDIGIAFGPGQPRREASLTVRREMTEYFRSLSSDGEPVVVRVGDAQMQGASSTTYFHSVNGCVSRAAWEQVPFRAVPYAEDRMLAIDMLQAGWAKAFVPTAPVIHSHDYRPLDLFRRSFDEWRGLREVTGHYEPYGLRTSSRWVLEQVRADLRFARHHESNSRRETLTAIPASLRHACLSHLGAVAGTRAHRLSPSLRQRMSLERRSSFVLQENDERVTLSSAPSVQ